MSSTVTVSSLVYQAGGRRILNDINLVIEKGEILAVMGRSGCGKTSLLKCLSGLVRPSSGSIQFNNTDLVRISEHALEAVRLKIGLVFQYAALFDSLTVWENVAFGPLHHRKQTRQQLDKLVADLLEQVGMPDTQHLYPSQLSGGMQKRVGLARALALQPELLLYDEPTSGLDPVIARTIDDLIVETRNRLAVTSVVVSHDISSVFRIADRVAMMEAGELIAVGTPAELRRSADSRVQQFLQASLQPAAMPTASV
jgi:phospholipid/cholesterol/gamma-HCH transport system ATP-binding protein